MYNVIEIIFNFWHELFSALNDILLNNLNIDLKIINIDFYSNEISLFNYFNLIFTFITIIFVIYVTFKFFKYLYKVVVRLWY